MQKAILVTLVVGSVILGGCTGNKFDAKPQEMADTLETSYLFEHESFTLKLPAEYAAAPNSVRPLTGEAFPEISFEVEKTDIEPTELLDFAKAKVERLCGQTDSCGKITASEPTKIAGKDALKFTVQMEGRNLGDQNGYLRSYNYSILNDGNLVQFSITTTDLEKQENVAKKVMLLEEILDSVNFVSFVSREDELAKYGEQTRSLEGEAIKFTGEEIGSGQILNDDENKTIDKWYFINEEGKTGGSSQKQLLNIDDQCHIHAVGFTNGSCIKYLSLEENKQVTYDGYNGPSILIYGETLPDQSIHVTDMVIQQ